jgi:hypothetical protein
VSSAPVAAAIRLLHEAADALDAAGGLGAGADELIAALVASERMARRMDRVAVALVAALDRQGVFAERGYKSPVRRRTGLVLGLVGIGAVLAVGMTATVRGFTAAVVESSESMVFDAQVPRLTVDVGSGDVTVGRAEGDRVEVTRTVRSPGSADPTFTETSTANGVALAAECGGALFGRCGRRAATSTSPTCADR